MSDSEEDQPRGRFSANYSSSEDEAYHTPKEADPLLHELEQQPSTSTVASERTERQIDLLALRSQTPFSDRNYDSDTTTVSEYSIMAEPQDAQLVTAEEYQEYQHLKQQQTQPPPVPTMQELMEWLIVVQEKTAAKESGPRINTGNMVRYFFWKLHGNILEKGIVLFTNFL